ncbi:MULTISPECIES: OmpP1/FadL family transporter [Pseudomonas]|uniref:Long-chain fatty acid transport protein n=1 Tax=Pseudomonas putida TaxID=303 RepID=A0A1B2F0Y0_PSEPU|nr:MULTISPECIES: outer membrane protein transport protein [Pseudomonas]ANY85874.1 Long-chain fatty acid transport protein precursor [Pseudomonas putida]MCL8305409.1 outer membrane protein transport protein [Pseudomonas putida]
MKKAMLKTSLGVAVALASSQLFAAGFALNEQSVSGMGTGFAGRSSSAEDASTVYGNPAGMSRLKREQVTVGGAAVIAKTDISGRGSNFGGETDGDMVPTVGVPMGYYVKPIDDHWSVGFGVYVPFGLITDYGGDDAARYWGKKSKVEVVTFQPTISYAFNDKVSVGFGPTINRIKGELGSNLSSQAFAGPGSRDGEVKIKGDDTAVGYNIGVLVQATDRTRLGLTYHSMVDYKLEGDTRVSYPLPIGLSGKFDASLKIKTPESVDFSITHELDDNWTLYAGSTWTRWSRLENITVENEAPAGYPLKTITEEQNWHDTWAHAIGAAYKVNKEWTLRAGFSVDQSPTNNHDRSPRIPTGDRKAVSFGAGWSPNDDMTIDVAYSYLWEEDTKVNNRPDNQQEGALKGSYQAKYENSAHGIGASLTYRF